jgi:hypothetical protein
MREVIQRVSRTGLAAIRWSRSWSDMVTLTKLSLRRWENASGMWGKWSGKVQKASKSCSSEAQRRMSAGRHGEVC